MQLLTATTIRELARRHSIRPSKSLGQNFVIDPNTVRRILRLAQIEPHDRVVEIGAGFGSLTLALSAAAAEVVAVEFDRNLLRALQEVLASASNVRLVSADAMRLDFDELLGGKRHRLISNLPYGIATPLVADILDSVPAIDDLFVMVQREAGERFVAPPGSKIYGSVSVMTGYHCDARLVGRVSSKVFWPVPRVDSVLIRMKRRPPLAEVPADEIRPVVRAAFGQRRKSVRNSLSAGLQIPTAVVETALEEAGLSSTARAESLSLEDFARLTRRLARTYFISR